MTDLALLNLKATVAMRDEDLRIATKHRVEAGARLASPGSERAYDGAVTWEDHCRREAENARARLLRHGR
jgi:hypothetical protein